MAKNDVALPSDGVKEEMLSEGFQGLESENSSNFGTMPADQTSPKGEGPEEHFEDPDDPCRSALMDCYNR